MAQQSVKMPTTEDLMSMWNASGLKEKIIFTLVMIAVWRFGVQMPLYGINNEVFSNIAQGNNIVGFLDLFTGGALGKVSILALGIGPFITSSIIVQLVSVVIPALEKLQKEEGEAGRRKLSQYTRVFTVVFPSSRPTLTFGKLTVGFLSVTDVFVSTFNTSGLAVVSVLTPADVFGTLIVLEPVSTFGTTTALDVFNACVMLNKREHKKAFTPGLLVKNMKITIEKSNEILEILSKYNMVYSANIELDDENHTVYYFNPTPSFIALLIFAREIIDKPHVFTYRYKNRKKPYLN